MSFCSTFPSFGLTQNANVITVPVRFHHSLLVSV